jgi:hypothetical protein
MAAKVTKQGKLKTQKYVGTCSGCDAEIECEKEDMSATKHDDIQGRTLYLVTCPTQGCKSDISVYPKR